MRVECLEFLAIGADAHPDLHAAVAEMVERGDLLRRHHDVAPHRQNEHAGSESQRLVVWAARNA